MDVLKFVEQCLNQVHQRLAQSLEGLSQEELVWRPAPHANCIAEIVWHVVRGEDRIRSRLRLGPEVWESQQWHQRFGYPREQSQNPDYQILKSSGLPPPRLEDLLAYMKAVHQDTLDKLHNLSPADLDRAPNPEYPEHTLVSVFRHVIIHQNNHHGQVDYIRGLMQSDWDLPPGTGLVQR